MSSQSSIIEKELTCSICTDLLYDPVTFLDCLHTNCGSCAKSWFASLSNNAATAAASSASAPPAKYTCPVCRSVVRATKHNSTLQCLLDDFIGNNPDKDRTDDEKTALRKLYSPGDGVLPGEAGTNPTSPTSRPALPDRRAPPARRVVPPRNTPDDGAHARLWAALAHTTHQSCIHCHTRIDYALRCRCPQCNILICVHCYRTGKSCQNPGARHVLVMQKLQPHPAPHIQSGVFCDICETWCDDANSHFWACSVCDNGMMSICRECVSHEQCCSHELKLYTNHRRPQGTAIVRGNAGDSVFAQFEDLVSRMGGLAIDTHTQLSVAGYVRAMSFTVSCDQCNSVIPPEHSYLHCATCNEGQWDMCMTCWYAGAEAAEDEDAGVFRCIAGHYMVLLSQNGEKGTHKLIQDAPHEPPEYVARTPAAGGQDWWGGPVGAKNAVAVKSHWPEVQGGPSGTVYRRDTPGVRACDYGGLLGFPEKAAISDIWVAFTEGDGNETVEYLWGWYAGVGGLFPRDCVRFTD